MNLVKNDFIPFVCFDFSILVISIVFLVNTIRLLLSSPTWKKSSTWPHFSPGEHFYIDFSNLIFNRIEFLSTFKTSFWTFSLQIFELWQQSLWIRIFILLSIKSSLSVYIIEEKLYDIKVIFPIVQKCGKMFTMQKMFNP